LAKVPFSVPSSAASPYKTKAVEFITFDLAPESRVGNLRAGLLENVHLAVSKTCNHKRLESLQLRCHLLKGDVS